MATITAAMVKDLREMTGAGMMDCKAALNETDGNMDAAVESLRKVLSEAEGESARVSASRTILELGLRAVEIGDIEERIEKLEALVKSKWKEPNHAREDQTPSRTAGGINGRA